MPTIIKPTVGRVVDFWPSSAVAEEVTILDPAQPFAATVAYVWNDRLVNLSAVDHAGVHLKFTSVRLVQEGDAPRSDGESVCTWMEYQLGQAKKYEALAEQKAAEERKRLEETQEQAREEKVAEDRQSPLTLGTAF